LSVFIIGCLTISIIIFAFSRLYFFLVSLVILDLVSVKANFWVERGKFIQRVLFSILLFALPVPLVDFGEGDLDKVGQVLNFFIGPVRISKVAQFKTGPLRLIESNPSFLYNWRSSLLLGLMLLYQRQGLQSRQSLKLVQVASKDILLVTSVAHGHNLLELIS